MIKKGSFLRKPGTLSFLASMIAVIGGLIIGLALLFLFNPNFALQGFSNIIVTGLKTPSKFAKVLYTAAPLMLTGLSVAFAFKTGLFNIGASGQYIVGAMLALIAGIAFQMSWPICLVFSILGGAIWGAIPGIFKAYFNVNEVITSIMFNWIGVFFVNLILTNIPMMVANYWGKLYQDRTPSLKNAAEAAVLPKLGLDKLLKSPYINIGIFIAIGVAIIIWIILKKTVFGYELKACGYNRNASIYAGINAKRNIVLSMTISGGLAGLAGGIYYLSGTAQYTFLKAIPLMGFNGIPVALLAASNPLGTIISALFISYIQVGGEAMQPEFAKEMIDIIIGVIIYMSAFSLLMREFLLKLLSKHSSKAKEEGKC